MEKKSVYSLLGLIILSLTLIACTFIVTRSLIKFKQGLGSINVKGCAEKNIHSDFVTWSGYVNAAADTEINAYALLEANVERVKESIQKLGVNLEDVTFSSLSHSIIHEVNSSGYRTNKVESVSLKQEFFISSNNIDLVKKLSQDITNLFKEGINIVSNPPKYFYSKLDELKISMLGAAALDARQRAEELVTNSGGHVGKLRLAQQGVFQITPVFSNSVSDYGEFDTSSVDKRIKAVVTMEFSIE